MSKKEILDQFGEQLIRSVRDRTIEKYEKIEHGSLKSQQGKELNQLLNTFNSDQKIIIRKLISATIDNSLFNLLDMIEQSDTTLKLVFNGQNFDELSDGLAGDLLTDDGWISRFSKVK